MVTVTLFFSFRSPYSYLAIRRWAGLLRQWRLTIDARPVYPLAIRDPAFFERNHPNWLRYTGQDMVRMAAYLGIPFAPPRPDPIVQDMATRRIAVEQPYIRRLVRMGQAAARAGRGFAFADAVTTLIWGGTPGWDEGRRLDEAIEAAGLDAAALTATVAAEPDVLDSEVAANQTALEAAGHWGVSTLVFDGEPFFGQDRIDVALWRMKQRGLEAR